MWLKVNIGISKRVSHASKFHIGPWNERTRRKKQRLRSDDFLLHFHTVFLQATWANSRPCNHVSFISSSPRLFSLPCRTGHKLEIENPFLASSSPLLLRFSCNSLSRCLTIHRTEALVLLSQAVRDCMSVRAFGAACNRSHLTKRSNIYRTRCKSRLNSCLNMDSLLTNGSEKEP